MLRSCRCLALLFICCTLGIAASNGCGVELGNKIADGGPTPTAHRDADSITIASFNIQVFGQSKLDKPAAMDVLVRVVRRFDVVAIQEVRSKEQDVLPRFLEQINADGSHYDFVIGPRIGRTTSKEQYAFIYDTTRLELKPNSVYTVPDPQDRLHREPLAASFKVRGPNASEAFTFTLVDIHTDPDETDEELDALADFFRQVQLHDPNEDDVILLGDLNVDEKHLGRLGRLPQIAYVVAGQPTNTLGTKTYDNFVFDQTATVEYRGEWGVLNLMSEFGLTQDQALEVSDHRPVWAVFAAREGAAASRIASQPDGSPSR